MNGMDLHEKIRFLRLVLVFLACSIFMRVHVDLATAEGSL